MTLKHRLPPIVMPKFNLISVALLLSFLVSNNLGLAQGSQTRLQRPTTLYGSAKKQTSTQAATTVIPKNSTILEGSGKIDNLFPTTEKKLNLLPLSAVKENNIIRPLTGTLSQSELNILASRDLIVLVDKSYSMKTRDCPPVIGAILVNDRAPGLMHELFGDQNAISRWQWVAAHALDFANQITPVKPDGFKLILFNQWRQIYEDVTPAQVPKIFYDTKVGGDTMLAQFLGEQLLQYVERKNKSPQTVRPLAIAVVTDGLPDDKNNLSEIIIHISKQIKTGNEIAITFIQVGESSKGGSFLSDLDNNLVRQGARFDLVDHKTFKQVQVSGLGRAIVDAVLEK